MANGFHVPILTLESLLLLLVDTIYADYDKALTHSIEPWLTELLFNHIKLKTFIMWEKYEETLRS